MPATNKLTMINNLNILVQSCTMCSLGSTQPCDKSGKKYNPHVLSNLNPTRFMVVGQNPGMTEIIQSIPFIGPSGDRFNKELAKHDLTRDEFYISNTVKCYTEGNAKPDFKHTSACEPILRMELGIVKPVMVITLGAVAFDCFCPDKSMADNLGSIVKSTKFNIDVYPIYHPSPMNLAVKERSDKFNEDIETLCKLIKRYKEVKNASYYSGSIQQSVS